LILTVWVVWQGQFLRFASADDEAMQASDSVIPGKKPTIVPVTKCCFRVMAWFEVELERFIWELAIGVSEDEST